MSKLGNCPNCGGQECLWLDEEEVVLKDTLKCTILIPQKKEICEKRR
jgi:hypothetical protein